MGDIAGRGEKMDDGCIKYKDVWLNGMVVEVYKSRVWD